MKSSLSHFFLVAVAMLFLGACSGVKYRNNSRQGLFQQNGSSRQSLAEENTSSIDDRPRGPVSGMSSEGFIWPLKTGVISSYYGQRRRDFHDGIDISAARGTPIYAAKDGVVIYSARKIRGYGNMIVLKHYDGTYTVYAHNQKNIAKKNKSVKQGDVIAKVGATGKATGPHVHFEVRKGKMPVDPVPYLPNHRSQYASSH